MKEKELISPVQLLFKIVDKKEANQIFKDKHYAHRAVPISWCFGAYFNNNLMGAISFGKPASYTLCNGIAGKENSSKVYELNRLWLDDELPKNSESRFIGWSLRELKKINPNLILVSFSDLNQNHKGIIYRATNWIYTGQTKPHLEWDDGTGKHNRHVKIEGSKPKQRTIKNRYVYFMNPDDKKFLRYKIMPLSSNG